MVTRHARTEQVEPTQTHRGKPPAHESKTVHKTGPERIEHLHQTYGNSAVQRLVEQQLHGNVRLGRPNDTYEREADRVADRVMAERVGSPARQGGTNADQESREEGHSQGASPSATATGPGRTLPDPVRTRFERAFGYDFGSVRVHPAADEVTTGLNARAVTVGRDIFFHRSQYRPESSDGARLIAHELTHVVQQRRQGPTRGTEQIRTSRTPSERIQGGFFGDVWEGVKGAAKTIGEGARTVGERIWEGTKAVGEHIWEGTKAVGAALWEGTKAVGEWGWNVLKGGAAVVWDLVTEAPERILRILEHVGTGVLGTLSWFWDGLKRLFTEPGSLGEWLVEGLLSGAAWVGRLFSKLVDLAGVGEVFDLINQILKFNTRTLTATERTEAEKVFGDSISYWQVRIDEFSLIAAIGKWSTGSSAMGVTTFHTINFTKKLNAAPGNTDMGWLIHELTHVAQYEHVGSQYMGEALHAQSTLGSKAYSYNKSDLATRPFSAFNREQQGEIAQTYYVNKIYDPSHPDHSLYEPRIDELRNGKV